MPQQLSRSGESSASGSPHRSRLDAAAARLLRLAAAARINGGSDASDMKNPLSPPRNRRENGDGLHAALPPPAMRYEWKEKTWAATDPPAPPLPNGDGQRLLQKPRPREVVPPSVAAPVAAENTRYRHGDDAIDAASTMAMALQASRCTATAAADASPSLAPASAATALSPLRCVDPETLLSPGSGQQLEYFEEYKARLEAAKGESVASEILAEAVYIFSIGTNDFILNYFTLPVRLVQYTPTEYVSYLVSLAEAAVRDAYHLGARKMGITGLPPFGCLPLSRTRNHREPDECNEEYNQLAMRYNAELQEAVTKLNGDLAGTLVVYVDIYSVLSDIVANPSDYGFENVAQGCCGTGLIETAVLCGLDEPLTCQDVDKYEFFDSAQPSEQVYRILADKIFKSTAGVFL